jgi:hypothetical protein
MRKYLKPAVTQREEKENEKEEKSHLQPPTRFFEPVGFETSNYVRSVERALRLGEDIPTILASSVCMYPCGTADAAAFRCNGTRAQSNTPRLQCVFALGKLDHPTRPGLCNLHPWIPSCAGEVPDRQSPAAMLEPATHAICATSTMGVKQVPRRDRPGHTKRLTVYSCPRRSSS